MKSRLILVGLGLAALACVSVALQAQETAAPGKGNTAAQVRDDITAAEQQILRSFSEFEQSLLRLKQRLARSSKKEDQERAKVLERVLDESRGLGIQIRLERLIEFLQKNQLNSVEPITSAANTSRKLADDLRLLLDRLREDPRGRQVQDEIAKLKDIIQKLEKNIYQQKEVQGITQIGKTEPRELQKNQEAVSKKTQEIEKALAKLLDKGNQGQGGEGKNQPGAPKDGPKGEGKAGESKGEGKTGEAARGETKDAGKGGEAGKGEAKSGQEGAGNKSGEGQEGESSKKGGQGSEQAGQGGAKEKGSKGGEGQPGEGKKGGEGAKGGAKGAGDKAGEKGGEAGAKGSEGSKAGQGSPKGGEAGAKKGGGEGSKGGEAGAKGSKGGEGSKGGQSGAKGGESKSQSGQQGQAKSGEKGDAQAKDDGSKQGGQGSKGGQGGQASSKGSKGGQGQEGQEGGQKGGQKEKDEIASSKKRVQEGNYEQKGAEDELGKDNKPEAVNKQGKAIQKLEEAQKKLERLLRQLREEEQERVLAQLQARCEKMLALQMIVLAGTEATHKGVEATADKKATRGHQQESLKLSDQEKEIVAEANKAIEMLEAEGTAVAFPEVFQQVREDMKHVQRRLEITDVGAVTQTIERDIIDTLKEMIEALKKQRQENKESKGEPKESKGGQPADPKLLEQIAELKMIRSLQLRVNARTQTYGRMYQEREGEQTANPTIQRELNNLSERQARIFEVTNKIAKGDNR